MLCLQKEMKRIIFNCSNTKLSKNGRQLLQLMDDQVALHLADLFRNNFNKYADFASPQILAGVPLA
jgi:hypothetical protein